MSADGEQHYNLIVATVASTLGAVLSDRPEENRVLILEDMSQDQLIHIRLHNTGPEPRGYMAVLANVANADDPDNVNRQLGFEHASRMGLTPETFEAEMREDVDRDLCWRHIMFFVSLLECAPYVSDFREYNRERLRRKLPDIVTGFRQYLAQSATQPQVDAIVVRSSRQPPCTENGRWFNQMLREVEKEFSGPNLSRPHTVRVFVYQQSPVDAASQHCPQ